MQRHLNYNGVIVPVETTRESRTRITIKNPFTGCQKYVGEGVFIGTHQEELTFTLRANGLWILKSMHRDTGMQLCGVTGTTSRFV